MKQILLLLFFVFQTIGTALHAQTFLPEQDCISPIQVCSKYVNLAYPYRGYGENIDSLPSYGTCTPISFEEKNSVWLRLEIVSAGMLGFNIIPTFDPGDSSGLDFDFDFMLLNMTNKSCSDILYDPSIPVGCNMRGSQFPTPITGMNDGPNPQDSPMITVDSGEVYYLVILKYYHGSSSDDTLRLPVLVDFSIGSCGICKVNEENSVSGVVYLDNNENCQLDTLDLKLKNTMVKLVPVEGNAPGIYTVTNRQGKYRMNAPSAGQYKLEVINPPITDLVCNPNNQIITIQEGGASNKLDFALHSKESCSDIFVQNSSTRLLRCFRTPRTIRVCNQGALPANNLVLRLDYDSVLIPVKAPLGFVEEYDDHYSIVLPEIPPFDCLVFQITDSVSCSSVGVNAACVNARVEPFTRCSSTVNTDVFNLDLESSCINGYQLKVTNTGTVNMSAPLSLKVYGDFTILRNEEIQLNAGEVYNLNLEDVNKNDYSAAIFEGAEILLTSNIHDCQQTQDMTSYWRSLTHSFNHYNDSLSCENIRSSYDPNDKVGYPSGLGAENIILREQKLKYKIRFQNTGSGMAYNVVVKDTLPAYLDESSIRIGNASHTYTFESSGRILNFSFPEIFLPDSASDPVGSNGFIEFYLDQFTDNPETYQISNRAAIYFDFNDPVITEPAVHNIQPIKLNLQAIQPEMVNLYPNPCDDGFFVNDCPRGSLISLFSTEGKLLSKVNGGNGTKFIPTKHLQDGLIVIRIDAADQIPLFQKLIIQHKEVGFILPEKRVSLVLKAPMGGYQ